MAGDWIKMRGGLFSSPKLIAMSRELQANDQFREWLTPGGGAAVNGQIVSDHGLRCVTGALLCVTWSWSRAFGKALPNGDCALPKITISDLDQIAGAPGVGVAMEAVGWAVSSDDPHGVRLPKFFLDHNVPMTAAEKQKAYRNRKKTEERVTKPLPTHGNKTVTREEKSREEKNKSARASASRFVKPTLEQVSAYCKERGNIVSPSRFFDHYESNGWRVGGKSPMKDWKAAVRNWEAREGESRVATPEDMKNYSPD